MTNKESVPLLDPRRANGKLQAELRAAFQRVLEGGQFILGNEVETFERECARYLGVEHAIGVSSGTDALLVAMMALGIGRGDEVICPTFTFFATAGTIWRTGATPVFVDSRPRCFNCDPKDVERKLTSRTRAIIPVHLFGQCAEMNAINDIARAKGVPVIEDAAQAIGAEYQGRKAGGLGTLGCFSFFPSKNLGGFGDAGLVTTHDGELAKRVRALRVHGGQQMYEHPEVGGNFRIDAMQAALLGVKLPHVEGYARQANAARYNELFIAAGVAKVACDGEPCAANCADGTQKPASAPLSLPAVCQSNHVFNQYVVRVHGAGRRDELLNVLRKQNIGCAVYYPKPLHQQPCFASLTSGAFPVAELLAEECLALPIFGELTSDELQRVVDCITGFFA